VPFAGHGDQGSWQHLPDETADRSGMLSIVYAPETGTHTVLIDGVKVFEFIYMPPDPDQIALY
jgi:hypothetical protein